jgi:hypothetical protein
MMISYIYNHSKGAIMTDFEKSYKKAKDMRQWESIITSELPEMEKLKQSFHWLTGWIIQQSENEMELLRALNDREGLVKERIKVSTIKYTQGIFEECYRRSRKGQA